MTSSAKIEKARVWRTNRSIPVERSGGAPACQRGKTLEADPHAAVDVAAVERRPCIHGPASVDAARGPQQRIPPRLSDIGEVFPVDEQPVTADLPQDEHTEYRVRTTLVAIRVRL